MQLRLTVQRRLRSGRAVYLLLFLCGVWTLLSPRLLPGFFLTRGGTGMATGASNATLGFGGIYVVSKQGSTRRKALVQAANVTELQLSIPTQPVWTDDDQGNFKLAQDSTISRGSLLAWLGHMHALRRFLDSGAETALILEDDVDWDIRLRTTQTPLVSTAMRNVLGGRPAASTVDDDDEAQRYPYGSPARWDLLYLGHCGDYWHGMDVAFVDGHVKPQDLEATPHAAFSDPSMPRLDDLHPFTASLLRNLGVGESTRLVHRSVFPLCTFGYAVSRGGALRLLELGGRKPAGRGHKAYDVLILHACRRDRDRDGLRCWTANPELFHHVPGPSIIDGEDGGKGLPPVDRAAKGQIEARGETANIDCGFWSGAFGFDDDDAARLDWLRREVGRKGRCLKPARDP
ncbi:hypothetical protein O9K51_10675 [Purpureocillium lavendulum]|uniref:Glycosyltransferase family 25 protein n=1 Tax=Purpureocillium lavendulum TaxID=1247861 RepID=A0AB34FD16_9HYPO|nr:hypothetical protein O9K51_10675 [Purpureocillium lavendulum]